MKVAVLSCCYDDSSSYEVIRVYAEKDFILAEKDLDLFKKYASDYRKWKLDYIEVYNTKDSEKLDIE